MWATEASQEVHLTFDDGPHPDITPWVLTCLEERQMTATFFAIGRRAQTHGALVQRMRDAGHAVGGHTMDHEHGWWTDTERYLDSAQASVEATGSHDRLFRPPHGKLTRAQVVSSSHAQVVMWDAERGLRRKGERGCPTGPSRKRHTRPGTIVVFHDSLKCATCCVSPARYLDLLKPGMTSASQAAKPE